MKYRGYEVEYLPTVNETKTMHGFLKMSWADFFRALVISVIVAVASYVLGVGDVWSLDWHILTNNAVMAGLASILTSLATADSGKVAGVIPVE